LLSKDARASGIVSEVEAAGEISGTEVDASFNVYSEARDYMACLFSTSEQNEHVLLTLK